MTTSLIILSFGNFKGDLKFTPHNSLNFKYNLKIPTITTLQQAFRSNIKGHRYNFPFTGTDILIKNSSKTKNSLLYLKLYYHTPHMDIQKVWLYPNTFP